MLLFLDENHVKTKRQSSRMGFLEFLGLDELADSINELTTGIDELRDEVISSVIGTGDDLKEVVADTVKDITSGN